MNHPANPRDLDTFESALLTELRAHVEARPAPITVGHQSAPTRRHYRRWAGGLAVAAATATAFVVASPGGPATSPAYAVEDGTGGDVVVTIHRLEDSAGLEHALQEKGIDADVSFDPGSTPGGTSFIVPGGSVGQPPPIEDSAAEVGAEEVDSTVTQTEEPADGSETGLSECGLEGGEPATLAQEGDDWVLTIPGDSILQDRAVSITTGADGNLGVTYAGSEPGTYCGVMSVGG